MKSPESQASARDNDRTQLTPAQPETRNQPTDNAFAAAVFAGTPICGSCGEHIGGDVYWNQWGPAHLSCIELSLSEEVEGLRSKVERRATSSGR